MIQLNEENCANIESAGSREWLETNGLGGFASSTVSGMNTRRYHGLLVAATNPPAGRLVLLSKLEETVVIDERRYELGTNQYPGAIHPSGFQYLVGFKLNPYPVFTFHVEDIEVEKHVAMIQGENTTVITYRARSLQGQLPASLKLEINPLIAFRDFHATTHENSGINPHLETVSGSVSITPYQGLPTLHLAHNAFEIAPAGNWYRDFEYAKEKERGLEYREDLFSPLTATFRLSAAENAVIIASTVVHDASESSALLRGEVARREQIAASAPFSDALTRALTSAADQFIVKRGELQTVIAGYPWFGDWGRDTMIALPGLALVTGRLDAAKNILLAFAENIDQGMLPNRFPDYPGDTNLEYNTVDAALWFFEAVRSYLYYGGDAAIVKKHIYPKLNEIVDWHIRGTRYGIRLDSDGLLHCGEPGVQLTWMDAKIGDWVVTPRHGKPVEIQALWYNALRIMETLAGRQAKKYRDLAEQAKLSFNEQFWNENDQCLFDVVDGERRDASIRPNQIFAVSLPHTMLDLDCARAVVETVQRELLTPAGLRSLSPRDPQYCGKYEGGVWERDSAYHQGTVWPWLIGPFITAYVKSYGRSKQAREQAAHWLESFYGMMGGCSLGQIPEIADADAPHQSRGCMAQAWSVAELLRAQLKTCIERRAAPPVRHDSTGGISKALINIYKL